MKYLLLIIISLQLFVNSYAQKQFTVIGLIKDQETLEPLHNVHVLNLKNKKGTISNQEGWFRIALEPNDYLKISLLGYYSVYLQAHRASDTMQVFLSKKVYQLETVTIYPWTKEEFKHQFIHLDIDDDSVKTLQLRLRVPKIELERERNYAIYERMRDPMPGNIKTVGIPIGISLGNYKNKKERQLSKLEKIKRWNQAEDKYWELAKKMTGYKGEKLNAFIRFCNFSGRYVTYAREYFLAFNIKKKILEFERLNRTEKTPDIEKK